MAQAVLVSMEAYSGYRHSLKAAEGDPVVKAYGEGVHDPDVSNVGKSIEVWKDGGNSALIGKKLSSLTVEDVNKLLKERVGDDLINKGKLWIEKNGEIAFSQTTEAAGWLQGVAAVPGMNSMAVFHDRWMASIKASNAVVLGVTIAPALYGNYLALGVSSHKYYVRNIENE